MSREAPLALALQRRNAVKEIALACGISPAAVSQWRRVPERHLEVVAALVGMTPTELRPDLFATAAGAECSGQAAA